MSTVLPSVNSSQTRMDAGVHRPSLPKNGVPLMGPISAAALVGGLIGWRRAERPYSDSDVLWSARAGRDLLNSLSIPRTDSYSWTAQGRAWIPNSWAWNAVLGMAYRLGGLVGIAMLGIVMSAAVGVAVLLVARAIGAKTAWTLVVLEIVGAVFGVFFYARAQVVDYLMILVLPLLLKRALTADRQVCRRSVLAIVLVQATWMNLHSAALLGPVLLLAAVAGATLQARRARSRTVTRGLAAVSLSALACLATPYGISPITHAEAVRAASVGLISEWEPAGVGDVVQLLGLVALVLGLFAALLAWRKRRFASVAMIMVLGVATAMAVRFAPMLALAAVPELAVVAGRIRVRAVFLRRTCALVIAILAVACLVGLGGFAKPGLRFYSPSLVTQIPSGCRLLNDLDIGGEVILTRPDVLVSIDSRNDLYGRAAELRSLRQLGEPAVGLAFIRSARITCVLTPSAAPLTRALRKQPGWRVIGSDGFRTLLVRTGAA